MFRFANPEYLWLLLLLPLLMLWRGRRGEAAAIMYPSLETARQVGGIFRSSAGSWLFFFRMGALALAIIALARPQEGNTRTQIEASGIDIMLSIDVSLSMEALDFEVNGEPVSRLTVVKNVVSQFISDRPADRIGMTVFAGQAYLVSPLTLDHDWLLKNLERVDTGIGEDGTAIGLGLVSALNRLRGSNAKSKIVILLTDGVNNTGKVSPLTAAEAAKALGIKVYTIAAGTRGRVPVPVRDKMGRGRIAMIEADVDEATMEKIAQETGGRFYRATDVRSLRRIYAEIDKLETTPRMVKRMENYREMFIWALVPAVLLLGLEVSLALTRWQKVP
jgi:Ca-activated chloride channel family protein